MSKQNKNSLEIILGSRMRLKMLKYLYRNYPGSFGLHSIARMIQETATQVVKELKSFESIGLINRGKRSATEKGKKNKPNRKKAKDRTVYSLNPDFEFFSELRSLILKPSPAERDRLARRLAGVGRIRLAIISGVFLNDPGGSIIREARTDLFVVGDEIDKRKLTFFLKALEAEVGKEIKFSLMEKDEFEYRYNMYDRFVRELLEGTHEKLINKLGV